MVAAAIGAAASVAGAASSIAGAGKSASGSSTNQYLNALAYNQNISNTSPYISAGQYAATQMGQLTPATEYPLDYQTSQVQAPSYTGVSSPTWTAGSAPTNQQGMMQGFSWNPTMQQLASTPGYQFTLQQGLEGVQNQYAGQGLGISGAEQKGAASYASGLANQTYNQQLQNAESIYGQNLNAYNANTANYQQQVNAYGQNVNAYNAQVGAYGQNINQYQQQLNAYSQQQQGYQNLFNDYWSNSNNRYNQLYSLAGLGVNAATGTSSSLASSASSAGTAAQTGAQTQAAGITNATNSLVNYANSAGFQNWINGLTGGSSVSPSTVASNQTYQNNAFASQPSNVYTVNQ